MSGCECKSGFFSLRDCDGAPAASCSACGRAVCTRHLSPASGFTECLDCHARAAQAPGEEQGHPKEPASFAEYQQSLAQQPGARPARGAGAGEDPALDDEWTYGARHRFYSSGYRPIYSGSHYSTYYDSYDTRSFDETDSGGSDAEEPAAGFGDS